MSELALLIKMKTEIEQYYLLVALIGVFGVFVVLGRAPSVLCSFCFCSHCAPVMVSCYGFVHTSQLLSCF